MRITRNELLAAAAESAVTGEQAARLWDALTGAKAHEQKFDVHHVLYYFGAVTAIAAMGWFVNRAWDSLDGLTIFLIAAVYAGVFAALGAWLWRNPATRTPGGLLVTMAVCLTPLGVYGLQRHFGLWAFDDPGIYRDFYRWIRGGWFAMEVATIAVGVAALRYVRFPFLTAPIAFALWFMSMDVTPILFAGEHGFIWDQRKIVSLWFGLAMIVTSYVVDLKAKKDFAFWAYAFGLTAFWGGLTALNSDSELAKFVYFLINVGLIALSVYLRRQVFLVFGALGVCAYLGHLAYELFRDSLLFPLALSIAGFLVLGAGLLLKRHHARIEAYVVNRLPAPVLRFRPPER
jgi:hypothetical protein